MAHKIYVQAMVIILDNGSQLTFDHTEGMLDVKTLNAPKIRHIIKTIKERGMSPEEWYESSEATPTWQLTDKNGNQYYYDGDI
jgi:hypothetical protein